VDIPEIFLVSHHDKAHHSKESTRKAGGFEGYPYKGINVRE